MPKAKAKSPQTQRKEPAKGQPTPPAQNEPKGPSVLYRAMMALNLIACGCVAMYTSYDEVSAFVKGLFGAARYPEAALRRGGPYEPPAGAPREVSMALLHSARVGEAWLANESVPKTKVVPSCTGRGDVYVRDGVCDCCDGSDENVQDNVTWCPNICQQRRNTTITRLLEKIRLVDAALTAKEQIIMANQLNWPALSSRIADTKENLQYESQRIQTEAQAEGADRPALYQQYQQLMAQIENFQPLFRLSKNDFGPYLSFFPLFGQCLEHSSNERYFKGGCAEPDAKNFTFTLCLFDKTYQQVLKEEPEDEAEPVVLGTYHGWVEEPMPAAYNQDPSPRLAQVYQDGAPCFEGPPRRVLVALECSDTTGISAVYENGKCTYEMVLSTPLVCTYKDLYELQEELKTY